METKQDNIAHKEYWRDLELGEEVLLGDRCHGKDREWFVITDIHLEYTKTINECSYLHQRKLDLNKIKAEAVRNFVLEHDCDVWVAGSPASESWITEQYAASLEVM